MPTMLSLDALKERDTASSAMEYDEYRRSFGRAFHSLPSRQRQIVGLSKLEGKKNAEIAEEINLSEEAVKNQLPFGLMAHRLSLEKIPLALIWIFFGN